MSFKGKACWGWGQLLRQGTLAPCTQSYGESTTHKNPWEKTKRRPIYPLVKPNVCKLLCIPFPKGYKSLPKKSAKTPKNCILCQPGRALSKKGSSTPMAKSSLCPTLWWQWLWQYIHLNLIGVIPSLMIENQFLWLHQLSIINYLWLKQWQAILQITINRFYKPFPGGWCITILITLQ